jgi:hypothetical protein
MFEVSDSDLRSLEAVWKFGKYVTPASGWLSGGHLARRTECGTHSGQPSGRRRYVQNRISKQLLRRFFVKAMSILILEK